MVHSNRNFSILCECFGTKQLELKINVHFLNPMGPKQIKITIIIIRTPSQHYYKIIL